MPMFNRKYIFIQGPFSSVYAMLDYVSLMECIPISNRKIPICDRKITIFNRKIPISNRKITICDRKITICDRKITIFNRRIPISNRKITICDRKITIFNRRIPIKIIGNTSTLSRGLRLIHIDPSRSFPIQIDPLVVGCQFLNGIGDMTDIKL